MGYRPPGVSESQYFVGPNRGFSWNYGKLNYQEDVATFADHIYNRGHWENLIKNNQYQDIYRAKLALMYKYRFITNSEYESIFRAYGLDPSNYKGYIAAGKRFIGNA